MRSGQSRPRRRLGALVVLSGCFIVSAFLRVGEVVAALPDGAEDGFGNPLAVPPGGIPPGAGTAAEPEAPMLLMAELQRQRAALEERQSRLDTREQVLETLERQLDRRLNELRDARDRLAKTANLVDDAAGKDVRRLAEMYQQMKPKQAGLIFDRMDAGFAAGFMAEMRPDAAALIMANMNADKAYAVSLLLAGRNAGRSTDPALPAVTR